MECSHGWRSPPPRATGTRGQELSKELAPAGRRKGRDVSAFGANIERHGSAAPAGAESIVECLPSTGFTRGYIPSPLAGQDCTGLPHSVQNGLEPTGYAHAAHRPRRRRKRRRKANGAAKSSQQIAA
jgi:hypothetical protein